MEQTINKTKVYINPPPRDRKCERCDKHVDELEPFDITDNLKLIGAKLVKTFRAMQEEELPEYEEVLNEYNTVAKSIGYDQVDDLLEAKYGKEKIENAMLYDQLRNTVGASWECKDCITK